VVNEVVEEYDMTFACWTCVSWMYCTAWHGGTCWGVADFGFMALHKNMEPGHRVGGGAVDVSFSVLDRVLNMRSWTWDKMCIS
jgi:hypothetical protein